MLECQRLSPEESTSKLYDDYLQTQYECSNHKELFVLLKFVENGSGNIQRKAIEMIGDEKLLDDIICNHPNGEMRTGAMIRLKWLKKHKGRQTKDEEGPAD